MADVTGPISTLSGARHRVPEGQKCDTHPDRDAVARIQGETDSFGAEMNDMCQECLDKHIAWQKSPEAAAHRIGQCEWCKSQATDLRDARDFDEGTSGRVYRVCGACIRKQNDQLAEEADEFDDGIWDDADYDDYDDFYEENDQP